MEKIITKILIAIALGLIIGVSIGVYNEIDSVKYFRGRHEIPAQLAQKLRSNDRDEYVTEETTTIFNYKMAWVSGLLTTSISIIILLIPNLMSKDKK